MYPAWIAAGLLAFTTVGLLYRGANRKKAFEQRLGQLEADKAYQQHVQEYLGWPHELRHLRTESECMDRLASLESTEKWLKASELPGAELRLAAVSRVRKLLESRIAMVGVERERLERRKDDEERAARFAREKAETEAKWAQEAQRSYYYDYSDAARVDGSGAGQRHLCLCGACLQDIFKLDFCAPGVTIARGFLIDRSGAPLKSRMTCDQCGNTVFHDQFDG